MKIKSAFMIFFIVSLTATPALSGSPNKDFNFILSHYYDINLSKTDSEYSKPTTSEVGLTAMTLIRVYQIAISSQDSPACNFHPSCSRFTMKAIQKTGFIRGTLLGADRLTRCHWFSKKLYSKYYGWDFEHEPYRLYDPIERYLNLNKYE